MNIDEEVIANQLEDEAIFYANKIASMQNVEIINKVTLSDILNENPSLSIRDAREQLMEENEHRDDLLQKCILARNSLIP